MLLAHSFLIFDRCRMISLFLDFFYLNLLLIRTSMKIGSCDGNVHFFFFFVFDKRSQKCSKYDFYIRNKRERKDWYCKFQVNSNSLFLIILWGHV